MAKRGINIYVFLMLEIISVSLCFGQDRKQIRKKIITEIDYLWSNDTIVKTLEFDSIGNQINPIDTSYEVCYCTKISTLDSSSSRILKKCYYSNGSCYFTETIVENKNELILRYNDQQDTMSIWIKCFDKKGKLISMTQYVDKGSLKYVFIGMKKESDYAILSQYLSQTNFYQTVSKGEIKVNFRTATISYFCQLTNAKLDLRDKFYFDKQFVIRKRINYFYHETLKKTFKTKTYYSFNQNLDIIEMKIIGEDGEIEKLKIISYTYY